MGKARRRSKRTGQTAHVYGETRYCAAPAWLISLRGLPDLHGVEYPVEPRRSKSIFTIRRSASNAENLG